MRKIKSHQHRLPATIAIIVGEPKLIGSWSVKVSEATSDSKQPDANSKVALADHDVFCHECGYNLRGITEPRCPECGKKSQALIDGESSIPWVQRKRIGHRRAFFATVKFAAFSPRKLAKNVHLSIDLREARMFRTRVVLLAITLLVGISSWLYCERAKPPFGAPDSYELLELILPIVCINVLAPLFFLIITGIPSCFLDYRDVPIEKRNSAISLSYYCTGPLIWWPIPVYLPIPILVDSHALDGVNDVLALAIMFLAVICPFTITGVWCHSVLRIATEIMGVKPLRFAWLIIGSHLLWLLTAIVVFGLIPITVFYLWVLFDVLS